MTTDNLPPLTEDMRWWPDDKQQALKEYARAAIAAHEAAKAPIPEHWREKAAQIVAAAASERSSEEPGNQAVMLLRVLLAIKPVSSAGDVAAIMRLADEYVDFLEGFDPEEQFKQATDSRSARRAALESAIRQRIAERGLLATRNAQLQRQLEASCDDMRSPAQPVSADVEAMCEALGDLEWLDTVLLKNAVAMLRSLDARIAELEGLLQAEFGAPCI